MNALATALVWGCVQVTLFSLIGAAAYLVARRRGPAAGSLLVFWSLAIVIGISALALSPWPRWYSVSQNRASEIGASREDAPVPGKSSAETPAIERDQAATADQSSRTDFHQDRLSVLSAAWNGFVQGLQRPAVAPASAAWHWPTVVASVLLVGIALALARLAVGSLALARYRRQTQIISDESLVGLVETLRSELGCRRAVELRESAEIFCPATIGSRRPLILLPLEWRNWTQSERRVVLAHELAHVARGDYAAWIWAQVSLALHFYNPLVHWLVACLRVEQEMAADARAAPLSGGRQSYLATLAEMALRQDDRQASWAARPFLPARGTFLRRIEMLRDTKNLRSAPLAATSRRLLLALLLGLGILVAGLRGPVGDPLAIAAAPQEKPDAASKDKEQAPIDLSWVPDDAMLVVAIRPADLARQEGVASILKMLDDAQSDFRRSGSKERIAFPPSEMKEFLGLPIEQLDEVEIVKVETPESHRIPFDVLVLRAKAAHDWRKSQLIEQFRAVQFVPGKPTPAVEVDPPPGHAGPLGFYYYLPNDRTLVAALDVKLLESLAGAKARAMPAWAKTWQQVARGDMAVMIDTQKVRKLVEGELQKQGSGGPEKLVLAMIAPLWEQPQRVFFGTHLAPSLGLQVVAECPSDETAKRLEQTIQGLLILGEGALREGQRNLDLIAKEATRDRGAAATAALEKANMMKPLLAAADDLLKQSHLERSGTTVTLQSQSKLAGVPMVASVVFPAVAKARQEGRKAMSINNMKQIMLALVNHHDAHRGFPPAALSKDGKSLLSWRVAILPYLEGQALYEQFHLDEPWDSEHNKSLAAKMPQVFRSPGSKLTDGRTVYLTPRGDTTAFPGQQATQIRDILDGTTNTISVVEVDDAHGVVWTKPDDWNFDPEHPKVGLGGQFEGGFLAAFCDGSVRFLRDNMDEKILKALFTRAGHEEVQMRELQQFIGQ